MENGETYTDESIFLLGRASYKLCDIPKRKLFEIYRKQKNKPEKSNPAFIAYIENNLERWKEEAKLQGLTLVTTIDQLIRDYKGITKSQFTQQVPEMSREEKLAEICKTGKFVYLTKKEARKALKKIRQTEQNHKKPIRSYECEECHWWHLTSMPIEEWKKERKVLRL